MTVFLEKSNTFEQLMDSHHEAHFLYIQDQIAQVLSGYNSQKANIPYRAAGKNCDIIIKDTISIKDFCRTNYGISPRFYPGDRFWYGIVNSGMGGKRIEYMPHVQYGFYLSLFHEIAHSISHKNETAIMKKYKDKKLADIISEKYAWDKAGEMVDLFRQTYDIDLLGEFESQHKINEYMDGWLSTYIPYELTQHTKDLYFTLECQEAI